MAVIPDPKLPPEAMPWAREITKLVRGTSTVVERVQQNVIVTDKQVGTATETASSAKSEVAAVIGEVEAVVGEIGLINDELALPITDAKLLAGSLTVWPFQNNTIPSGALEPGAVGQSDIADFAITAKKFNDNRHHIF